MSQDPASGRNRPPSFSRRDLLRYTAAAAATTAAASAAASAVAPPAASAAPTVVPRIGWSAAISELPTRLAQFPGTRYIRIFRQAGDGLPAWSRLDVIPGDVVVHLSVKDRGLPIANWLSARPARWTAPLVFTIDHEPEQQRNGDPTPAVFHDEWRELTESLTGHPRRTDIVLTPTFTRFAAELAPDLATWYPRFGRVVELPGVDALAFDVYNPGSEYQTSAQMFAWVVGFARDHALPLYIAEWGRKRLAPDDGTEAARRMRRDIAYLRARGVAGTAWFYTGGDDLDTGDGGRPRARERRALADLIAAQ